MRKSSFTLTLKLLFEIYLVASRLVASVYMLLCIGKFFGIFYSKKQLINKRAGIEE
jgi:hypothetical protein